MSRLLERLSAAIRTRNYSVRTERTYRRWVIRYVRFCRMRHPRECGLAEVRAFVRRFRFGRSMSTWCGER